MSGLLAQTVTFREPLASNRVQDTGYRNWGSSCYFPHFLQSDAVIWRQTEPWLLPSISFTVHPNIHRCAVWSEPHVCDVFWRAGKIFTPYPTTSSIGLLYIHRANQPSVSSTKMCTGLFCHVALYSRWSTVSSASTCTSQLSHLLRNTANRLTSWLPWQYAIFDPWVVILLLPSLAL